ncbi:MAG TPA: DUF5686 family protein [Bacteroidia bacterium]|nr:DUF5686 family protein [Bacteroidia bacterium]
MIFDKVRLKQFLLFVFLTCSFSHSFSQVMTRIRGTVLDEKTGEPLPFVNIIFVGKPNIGTATDFSGRFDLQSQWGTDQISIKYLGYETQVKKIEPGKSQTVDILLKQTAQQLKEVVIKGGKRYRNKDNPAVELIKRVVANKDKNRKEGFDFYSYDKYEKVEFDLNNIDEKFRKKKIMKKFQIVFNYVDTSELNGKPYLPLWFRETKSKVYYRKEPKEQKEYIYGTKQVGFEGYVDDQGLSSYIDNMYQDVNIYDNNIALLTNQFVSPIAAIAPVFYKFFIVDTEMVNNVNCVNLAFITRNHSDFGFTGNLYITLDSTYAVKKVEMGVPKEINLNFIQGLKVEQEFDLVNEKGMMLSKDQITIDFNISKKSRGLQGKKTVSYRDYKINEPLEDSLFDGPTKVIMLDSSKQRDESFWIANRHEQLTKKEEGIFEMIDTVKNIPAFKHIMDAIFFVITGYHDFGPLSIGPVAAFYSFNDVEGFRARFGWKTTPKFSNKLMWETYAAYGFGKSFNGGPEFTFKERFKHFNAFYYTFNKDNLVYPYHYLKATYQHDLKIPGQELQFINEDNFLLSFKRGVNDKMFFNDMFKFEYLREKSNGMTYNFAVKHLESKPFGNLYYAYDTLPDHQTFDKITTSEAIVDLRFAPNEKYYQGKAYRIPIFTKYPIFRLTSTFGFKDVLNSEYSYQHFQFGFFKRVYISPFGFGDLNLEAGKIFGRVPYPLLVFPKANQTYSYQLESYNLMNFLEFINDQYVALNYQHFFNGFFFNKIPLLKKLEWRETCSVKVLYGSVSDKNNPAKHPGEIFIFPTDTAGIPLTYTLAKKPYVEVSAGVGNVFKILRIEVIKRLTYLDNPHVSDFGIRARAKFDF